MLVLTWNQARLLSGETIEPSLHSLSRRLVDKVGYRQCWFGLGSGVETLTPVAHTGFPGDGAEALDPTLVDPGCRPDPTVMRDLQSEAAPKPLQTRGPPASGARTDGTAVAA